MSYSTMKILGLFVFILNPYYTMAYNPQDLQRALTGDKNLVGADLQGAVFKDVDLSYTNLTHANLFKARLENVNLKGARLVHTNLKKSYISFCLHSFDNTFLNHVNISQATIDFFSASNAQFNDVTFAGSTFHRLSITESTLNQVDFSRCVFTSDCSFMECQLDNVTMQKCSFDDFFIGECSLDNINMQDALIKEGQCRICKLRNIDGRTWKNVDFRNATIMDFWFVGDLICFRDKQEARNPNLTPLEPPWYYTLSLVLNPLHAAKRMLCDYDEYNINSVWVGAHFEGAQFFGAGLTNIILRGCTGIDSMLAARRGGLFVNVIVEDTTKHTYFRISDKD